MTTTEPDVLNPSVVGGIRWSFHGGGCSFVAESIVSPWVSIQCTQLLHVLLWLYEYRDQ
jgi:hypothetical protein